MLCCGLTTAAPQPQPWELCGTLPPADPDVAAGPVTPVKPCSTVPGIATISCPSLGFRKRINHLYFTCFSFKPAQLPTMGRARQPFQLPRGHTQTSTTTGATSLNSSPRLLISRCGRFRERLSFRRLVPPEVSICLTLPTTQTVVFTISLQYLELLTKVLLKAY